MQSFWVYLRLRRFWAYLHLRWMQSCDVRQHRLSKVRGVIHDWLVQEQALGGDVAIDAVYDRYIELDASLLLAAHGCGDWILNLRLETTRNRLSSKRRMAVLCPLACPPFNNHNHKI